jgi:apolipoprotein D and lipocalin family protein
MKSSIFTALFFLFSILSVQASELKTVGSLDIQRYQGLWYEIAKFPNSFQKNCDGATAEYRLRADAKVQVINRCFKTKDGVPTGAVSSVDGLAWIPNPAAEPAKLKVSFLPAWLRFLGIGAKYWVIDLDTDYQWVAVSEPGRDYFWILSRTPVLDVQTLDGILKRAADQGLDLSRLVYSHHAVSKH